MEWFNRVEKDEGRYFHIVEGKNKGRGTALHEAVKDEALEAALHTAAACGCVELIHTLLEALADPLASDELGWTPADWARLQTDGVGLPCFREVGLKRLVEMEGGSRSDAQVVLKPVVSPTYARVLLTSSR